MMGGSEKAVWTKTLLDVLHYRLFREVTGCRQRTFESVCGRWRVTRRECARQEGGKWLLYVAHTNDSGRRIILPSEERLMAWLARFRLDMPHEAIY